MDNNSLENSAVTLPNADQSNAIRPEETTTQETAGNPAFERIAPKVGKESGWKKVKGYLFGAVMTAMAAVSIPAGASSVKPADENLIVTPPQNETAKKTTSWDTGAAAVDLNLSNGPEAFLDAKGRQMGGSRPRSGTTPPQDSNQ